MHLNEEPIFFVLEIKFYLYLLSIQRALSTGISEFLSSHASK